MSDSTQEPSLVPRASKPRRRHKSSNTKTVLRIPDFRSLATSTEAINGQPANEDDSEQVESVVANAVDSDNDTTVQLPAKRPSLKAQLTAAGIIAALVAWVMIVFSGGNSKPTLDDMPTIAERPSTQSPIAELVESSADAEQQPISKFTNREAEELESPPQQVVASSDQAGAIEAESAVVDPSPSVGLSLDEPYLTDANAEIPADAPYVEDPYVGDSYETETAGNDRIAFDNASSEAPTQGDYRERFVESEAGTAADLQENGNPQANGDSQYAGPQFGPTLQTPNPGRDNLQGNVDRPYRDSGYQATNPDNRRVEYQARQPRQQQMARPTNGGERYAPPARAQTADRQTRPATYQARSDNAAATGYPTTDPATFWYPPSEFGNNVPQTATRADRGRQPRQ